MNIVTEKNDLFNIKAIGNTLVLVDTSNLIVVKKNNFTYNTLLNVNPEIVLKSTPVTPIVIR